VEDVDGYTYFPKNFLRREFFEPSDHTSTCGWKGDATSYTIRVNDPTNPDAAWEYRQPKPAAARQGSRGVLAGRDGRVV